MEKINCWNQITDINIIKKGLEKYLTNAKEVVDMFLEDLKGSKEQLECISNDNYYLLLVNILDIYNGTDATELLEVENVAELILTEKGEQLYDFITNNYKYFDDLDNRLSIDNNATYDIERYMPNVYDYIIINGLNKILK